MAGKDVNNNKIGVLALQGDVSLHVEALLELGITATLVKMPAQLKKLDGLIVPGGESTALLKLAEPIGMLEAIVAFVQAGGSIFGTCAGAILLAKNVTNPAQKSLGLIDITIERNGYGRQVDSAEAVAQAKQPFATGELPITLIRAPRITAVGRGAKVLATYRGEPVLVQQGNIMAATFHPELDVDTRVYTYWLR